MSLREGHMGPLVRRGDCGCSEMDGPRGLGGRLVGVRVPTVELPFAPEAPVSLAALARRRGLVVFFYPGVGMWMDGERDVDLTRILSWGEHDLELEVAGYTLVGVSTQPPSIQAKFASDELLGYLLLSDSELELARVLGLPTISVAEGRVYDRLTLIVQDGRIARVFYPVDPARDAATVSDWIRRIRA